MILDNMRNFSIIGFKLITLREKGKMVVDLLKLNEDFFDGDVYLLKLGKKMENTDRVEYRITLILYPNGTIHRLSTQIKRPVQPTGEIR